MTRIDTFRARGGGRGDLVVSRKRAGTGEPDSPFFLPGGGN